MGRERPEDRLDRWSLPRGSRGDPAVSPRLQQRPPRPQMGSQGKWSRGRAGGGGGGGTLQRVPASARAHWPWGGQGISEQSPHHVTTLHCHLRKLGTCRGRAGGAHRDLTGCPALLGTLVRAGITPHRSSTRQRPNACQMKTWRVRGQDGWWISQGLCSKTLELMVETEFLRCLISRPQGKRETPSLLATWRTWVSCPV